MRRVLLALVSTAALAATVVGLPASPAAGEDDPVADVAVDVVGDTDVVTLPDANGGAADVRYEVTVSNTGPSATPVVLTDKTIGGRFVAADSSVPSLECLVPADGASDPEITCTFSLDAGTDRSITVAIEAPETAGSTVTSSASVAVPSTVVDPDTSNNTDSETTTVAEVADLSVTVADTPDPVTAGEIVVYSVTITNNGPHAAPGATLTDSTPGGELFDVPGGCAASDGDGDGKADTVTCSLGGIAAGGSVSVDVKIISPAADGTLTNTASVTLDADPNLLVDNDPANDTDSEATAVSTSQDSSTGFVAPGDCLTFQTHETCVPADAANGVIVTAFEVAETAGQVCGDTLCDDGVHIDFDPDPDYQGTVVVTTNFGPGAPCRGLGNGECTALYWNKLGVTNGNELLPKCSDTGGATPCVQRVFKVDGDMLHEVLLVSEDPDLIPPIKL